jgi:Asp-tRNA(Asn)/Glu-tRNA(Gln) amidotransferase A subunit family amidase
MSIPNGLHEGLPIGLQIMTKAFGEGEMMAFSNYLLKIIIRNYSRFIVK